MAQGKTLTHLREQKRRVKTDICPSYWYAQRPYNAFIKILSQSGCLASSCCQNKSDFCQILEEVRVQFFTFGFCPTLG